MTPRTVRRLQQSIFPVLLWLLLSPLISCSREVYLRYTRDLTPGGQVQVVWDTSKFGASQKVLVSVLRKVESAGVEQAEVINSGLTVNDGQLEIRIPAQMSSGEYVVSVRGGTEDRNNKEGVIVFLSKPFVLKEEVVDFATGNEDSSSTRSSGNEDSSSTRSSGNEDRSSTRSSGNSYTSSFAREKSSSSPREKIRRGSGDASVNNGAIQKDVTPPSLSSRYSTDGGYAGSLNDDWTSFFPPFADNAFIALHQPSSSIYVDSERAPVRWTVKEQKHYGPVIVAVKQVKEDNTIRLVDIFRVEPEAALDVQFDPACGGGTYFVDLSLNDVAVNNMKNYVRSNTFQFGQQNGKNVLYPTSECTVVAHLTVTDSSSAAAVNTNTIKNGISDFFLGIYKWIKDLSHWKPTNLELSVLILGSVATVVLILLLCCCCCGCCCCCAGRRKRSTSQLTRPNPRILATGPFSGAAYAYPRDRVMPFSPRGMHHPNQNLGGIPSSQQQIPFPTTTNNPFEMHHLSDHHRQPVGTQPTAPPLSEASFSKQPIFR
eukprot:TRINITY_DN61557_c0_g1_i1.p1 TRINITY_DN61557_c0_g1~~TRINITY_DN61557_c0_g1_i1.p1  ORF type:complete len:543 (+),score=45.82 TRINITY_DN61557_c0_g1_i1:60-1688(+)